VFVGGVPAIKGLIKDLGKEGVTVSPKHIAVARYPCTSEQFEALLLTRMDGTRLDHIEQLGLDGGILERGFYARQLSVYMKYFQRKQLAILLTEELFSGFEESVYKIQRFLGVPFHNYSSRVYVNERGFTVLKDLTSKAAGTPYSPLSEHLRSLLVDYYRESVQELTNFVAMERLQRAWNHVPLALDREIDEEDEDDDEGDEGAALPAAEAAA
jgi:hypothetical protein